MWVDLQRFEYHGSPSVDIYSWVTIVKTYWEEVQKHFIPSGINIEYMKVLFSGIKLSEKSTFYVTLIFGDAVVAKII